MSCGKKDQYLTSDERTGDIIRTADSEEEFLYCKRLVTEGWKNVQKDFLMGDVTQGLRTWRLTD